MSRLTAIIIAAVVCIIVALGWAVNHYRGNAITYKDQRDKVIEKLTLANATIKDMTIRQRDVAALDAKYTKELADAKKTISDLRRDVDYSRRSTELFRSPGRNRSHRQNDSWHAGLHQRAVPQITASQ